MTITHIEHIGIAVNSLEEAIPRFEAQFGFSCHKVETVEEQKVKVAFFEVGEVHLELLEPTDEESPIARYLSKRGEGIHHIAFASNDLEGQIQMALNAGAKMIHETPQKGANEAQIAFMHPKSAHGVLVEFCQKGSGQKAKKEPAEADSTRES